MYRGRHNHIPPISRVLLFAGSSRATFWRPVLPSGNANVKLLTSTFGERRSVGAIFVKNWINSEMYDESLVKIERWKVDRSWRSRAFTLPRRALLKSLFSIQSANQYVNIGLMLKRTVCRFSSMAAHNIVARAPLVAVVGATGTGKSEVSLDNFWCIPPKRNLARK